MSRTCKLLVCSGFSELVFVLIFFFCGFLNRVIDDIFSSLRVVATANSQIIEQKEIDRICQNWFLILKVNFESKKILL